MRSMMLPSRASSAVMLFDPVTKLDASAALRPRCSASFLIVAAASSSIFRESVIPPTPTGVYAPTLVAGAIAATGQDIRMNAPADAALAPSGAT